MPAPDGRRPGRRCAIFEAASWWSWACSPSIFGGFRPGFATAAEISAFAAVYALLVGEIAFRELSLRGTALCFVHAATRSGLVLFIVAAAQAVADAMIALSHDHGTSLFMLLSIGITPLHYGVVLAIAMGIGLFAPPLALWLPHAVGY